LPRRFYRNFDSSARFGALLGIVALFILSACSQTGSSSGFGAPTTRGPAAFPTGEILGSGRIRVALLVPLTATGNAGLLAQNLKNAADLAIREFQTPGIQVLVKDTAGTADGARMAASQAISEGAELIIGPLFSSSVAAVSQVARSSGVPVIAFSTDTAKATRGVYLLSFLPQSNVDRIITFAASRGKRSFAALLPNTADGTVFEAVLQRAVANSGGRIMTVARYDLDRLSMQEQATAVASLAKSGTVDAIFMPGAGDAAPFLSQIMATAGVKSSDIVFLGSGQWDDQRITRESNLNGGLYPAPDRSGFAGFSKRYQATFGAAPYRTATLAYDATSLAAGLASRYGDQRFTPQTLTNPNGFIGLDGAFRFLQNGTNQRGLAIFQINNGTSDIVDPAPRSFTGTGT
jgi:ABC-type branched-subunit amino acid transport system substrate-binding protein